MAEIWMQYSEGDEVRFSRTGQFGIVTNVDETNGIYTIDIDGVKYSVEEKELS